MDTTIEKSATESPAVDADGQQPSIEEKGDVVELTGSYTAEEEKQVLRKIDRTILPMMCFIFFLQYLDKQTLSYASVGLCIQNCRYHVTDHVRSLASFRI